jgi:hypothetical protein
LRLVGFRGILTPVREDASRLMRGDEVLYCASCGIASKNFNVSPIGFAKPS